MNDRSALPRHLAHVDPASGRAHSLEEHLEGVGALAARFAEGFGGGEWARLAGLWHDLGKYADDFQAMIRQANGMEAHLEDASIPLRVDHSSAGALHAMARSRALGPYLAYVIAGHHAGLADTAELKERIDRQKERLGAATAGGAPAALLERELPALPGELKGVPAERVEMWLRMLFSALCDADFLDTEAFYAPHRAGLREASPSPGELRPRLRAFIEQLERAAVERGSSAVNTVRREVREACELAAAQAPGFFTLTVPTGGGKTLASMQFALDHAQAHGLGRVVVAIPYTSIIEQNAQVYRAALGDDAVLEHHSALDPSRETAWNRLASENWEAPVVVTTTVQLFESLFANRPSACRKLHRLTRSVIVLDEAQTLPPGLLSPILDALKTLVEQHGASVVVCTATQPALNKGPRLTIGVDGSREIVPPAVRAFERLRRVSVRWPSSEKATTYAQLAEEVARERDVLVVVHRRKDARDLCAQLDERLGHEQTVHLSALMCAEHRSRVLEQIKERKRRGEPLRVVATQLVEAGVDLDFPIVYRALAGVDALAQAAGRCNREGLLESGELRVFVAPTRPPKGVLQTALTITEGMLRASPTLDLFSTATYRHFFETLYGTRHLDEKGIQEERRKRNFRVVAGLFRMIEDEHSMPVVAPYDDSMRRVAELERLGPSRARLRALQRYVVLAPRRLVEAWIQVGAARRVADTITVLADGYTSSYDTRFGLETDRVGAVDPALLVVEG